MRSPSLSFSLSSSRLSLRSISLPSSSLLAQPLFLPLIPSNRTSLDIPTVVSSVPSRRRRRRCLPLLLGSSRFFFHSLFLVPPPPPSLSPRLTRPTLLAILVLPAREERERLARNPPQNKRPSRRSRSRAARACSRARLPFRVFLTIDSLPSPSAKLPADAVRKERGPESGHEEMRLPRALFLFLSSRSASLFSISVPRLRARRLRARGDCETR